MNDRYLFRAKRKNWRELPKEMWWVEGYLYGIWERRYILWGMTNDVPNMVEVDPSTICQCTGLKDKNGKLIWENDIIEAWSQGRCAIGKIKHRIDGTWIMYPAWQNREMWYLLPNDDGITTVEVIGNIFDNKELLEREDKDENNY